MNIQDFFNYLESQTFLGVSLLSIFGMVIIVVLAVILERITTRYLRRFAKRMSLEPYVTNSLVLTFRLLILIGAIASVFGVGGLPTEWFVALSALGGAAVGFASTKTIGNVIAGLFLLITRPFRVGDYVRIDGVEGIVQEISLNYAKILTSSNNMVSISTQRILDRDIINYRFRGDESNLFCYGFELNFDHVLSTEKVEKMLDSIIERYAEKLPRKPEYQSSRLTSFARYYMFYIYVEDPRDIFVLQPQLVREIIQAWEKAKIQGK